jgi:hypothetical protein
MRLYTPLHERMSRLLAGYDDAQLAILLDFAERSLAILGEETERLTAADPEGQ